MRNSIIALLLFFGCFVGTARGQTGVIALSVTSTPASIVVNQACNYVVIQENSATPSYAYTITLPGSATGITEPAGTRFVFSASANGFVNGQILGTITVASGSANFVGIESLSTPTVPVKLSSGSGGSGIVVDGPVTPDDCPSWVSNSPVTIGDSGVACNNETGISLAGNITSTGGSISAASGFTVPFVPTGAMTSGTFVVLLSDGSVQKATTSTTSGIIGIVQTTFAVAQVALSGVANLGIDNACTELYEPIIESTSTNGDGHCTTSPGTSQVAAIATLVTVGAGSENVIVLPFTRNGSSASSQYASQYSSDGVGGFGGTSVPATKGIFSLVYKLPTDAAVAPAPLQSGIGGSSITGAASSYTVSFSDNQTFLTHDVAGSASVTVTIPTPATLENLGFGFRYSNHSAHTDTISPTTWMVQSGTHAAGSTLSVASGEACTISIDNFNASTWLADCVTLQ